MDDEVATKFSRMMTLVVFSPIYLRSRANLGFSLAGYRWLSALETVSPRSEIWM